MSFGEDVKTERLRRGWSQQELAERVGTTQSTIDRIERGESARSRLAPALSALLEIGIPVATSAGKPATKIYVDQATSDGLDLQPLEVFSAVGEKDGCFRILRALAAIERRVMALRAVKGAFGFIVPNYDMEPAFEANEIAFVHPHLTLVRNCDVLFAAPDEDSGGIAVFDATLARLMNWDADHWHVRYWNLGGKGAADKRLSRADWPNAWRVVGKSTRI